MKLRRFNSWPKVIDIKCWTKAHTRVTLTPSSVLNRCALLSRSLCLGGGDLIDERTAYQQGFWSINLRWEEFSHYGQSPHQPPSALPFLVTWLCFPVPMVSEGRELWGLSQRAQIRGLMEQPQPRGREHLFCNQGASFSGCKPPLPTVLPRPGFLGIFYPLFNRLGLPSTPASVPTLLWHTPSLFSWVSVSKIKRQSGCQSIPLALPGPESRSVSIHAVGVINLVLRMQPCSRVLEGISLSPPVSPTESMGLLVITTFSSDMHKLLREPFRKHKHFYPKMSWLGELRHLKDTFGKS